MSWLALTSKVCMFLKKMNVRLVLNGRHSARGDTVTKYRGEQIFALFKELELCILNTSQFYTLPITERLFPLFEFILMLSRCSNGL